MIVRAALRNLARHRWRSRLTAGGVAVAVAFLVWTQGLMGAFFDGMVEAATRVQLGEVVVTTADRVESPSIHDAFPADAAMLERIGGVPGVTGAARRLETFGLVGHERRSQVAWLTGVDPEHERRVSAIPGSVVRGAWLGEARGEGTGPIPAVLGEGFARQLALEVGDEVVVLLQGADGSLGNDVLRVTGIARTGSSTFDRQAVFVPLEDARWLTALEGRAHSIVVSLARGTDPGAATTAVRRVLADGDPAADPGKQLVVRTWREIVPELAAMIELSRSSMGFLYLIVFVVAGLGVVNAQRMSALERRREFGVMLAIGTTPARLAWSILVETAILTAAGVAAGAAIGLAVNAWFQAYGFDMRVFTEHGSGFTWQGTSFDVLHFRLTASSVLVPSLAILAVGVVCGLWPALQSARIDAVRAIAGRT